MRLDQCFVKVSLLGGLVPVLRWMELDFVSLRGTAESSRVFWGVSGLSTTSGCLSADGWSVSLSCCLACGI